LSRTLSDLGPVSCIRTTEAVELFPQSRGHLIPPKISYCPPKPKQNRNIAAACRRKSESKKSVALDRDGNTMFAIRLRVISEDLTGYSGTGSAGGTTRQVDNKSHFSACWHLARRSYVQASRAYIVSNAIKVDRLILRINSPELDRKRFLHSRLRASFEITR